MVSSYWFYPVSSVVVGEDVVEDTAGVLVAGEVNTVAGVVVDVGVVDGEIVGPVEE